MKEREIELNDLPAPGEPLKPMVDPDNAKLLDEALSQRIAILSAIMSKNELRHVKKRIAKLTKILNNAQYNSLVTQRYSLYQKLLHLKHVARTKPTLKSKIAPIAKKIIVKGNAINSKIKSLQPLVDEFDLLTNRVNAHKTAKQYEADENEKRKKFETEAIVWCEQIKAVFRQSPRLHHNYTDSKGRNQLKIPIIRQIFFKDDKVLYLVQTMKQSLFQRFLGKWDSALPYGVDVTDLTSDVTLQNLSIACNRNVEIERSKRGTSLFYVISRLDAPDGIPSKVLYGKCIDWYPIADHTKTPWIAGITTDRKVEFYNFEDLPHILIAGSTQSGKSNHVNQMIATIATMNTPQEVRLQLIDLKGGIEFTHWSGLAHQLKPMVKTANDVLDTLRYIRGIMEQRLATFEAIKAKNLKSFNEKAKTKIPRIICIVDEMATLLGLDITTDIHNELRVLSSQGRAVGVHLVLCTQHSSVDVLPGWVKTNMTMRISGKMPSVAASMVILDSVTASTLPNLPGRLVFSIGRNETIAQSPYISDEEIANAVIISNQFSTTESDELNAVVVKKDFTIEDFVDMVLTQLDNKLSYKRAYDLLPKSSQVTQNYLKNFVDDILDKGGITHKGIEYGLTKKLRSYVLVPISRDMSHMTEDDTQELKTEHLDIEAENA